MPKIGLVRAEPQRTCVACRRTADKSRFVRLVRRPDGKVVSDMAGRTSGRGAYLCVAGDCIDRGLRTGKVAHALKTTIERAEADELVSCLAAANGRKEVSSS